tara:strand:- start:1931 stop:2299 length:369 start_codon:yes stop_codon:yes gene_type:complete
MNAIYITPYYDSINKIYRNIIIIDNKPLDKLNKFLKQINYKSPSSYTNNYNTTNSCCSIGCIYAFKSLCNESELMCVDEIPKLFNILIENGYNIDTSITDMMFKSEIKQENKRLLCYISLKT